MLRGTRFLTERLRLRSWRGDDVERYSDACNTPGVMRWLGGVQSRPEVSAEVRYFIGAEYRDGHTFWAVEHRSEPTFLGFCGLLTIRERDCPFRGEVEIGWRIREDQWRKGFAYEAASATLSYAFKQLRLPLVVSRAAAGNTASRKLMRKLGMRRCRDLDYRPRGENDKLAVYSISAEEWRDARIDGLRTVPSASNAGREKI